jgi:hypothetical protein
MIGTASHFAPTSVGRSQLQIEEGRPRFGHRLDQQAAIEKQVAGLATGFGDQKASMAGGTMRGTVISMRDWIMVSADGIAATYLKAAQGTSQNRSKPVGDFNQAAERSLRPSRGGIDQQPTTEWTAWRTWL